MQQFIVKARMYFGKWWLRIDDSRTHKNQSMEGPFKSLDDAETRSKSLCSNDRYVSERL